MANLIRRALSVTVVVLLALAAATPVHGHGDMSGPQDAFQDFGVLIILCAAALVGAVVVIWALVSPAPANGGQPGKAGRRGRRHA